MTATGKALDAVHELNASDVEHDAALVRREHFRRALGKHFYSYEFAWSYCAAERECLRAAGYDVPRVARRVGYAR